LRDGRRLQGLHAAAAHFRREQKISGQLAKRLLRLDDACAVVLHITVVNAEMLCRHLFDQLDGNQYTEKYADEVAGGLHTGALPDECPMLAHPVQELELAGDSHVDPDDASLDTKGMALEEQKPVGAVAVEAHLAMQAKKAVKFAAQSFEVEPAGGKPVVADKFFQKGAAAPVAPSPVEGAAHILSCSLSRAGRAGRCRSRSRGRFRLGN
jgi:hypothetical protein